MILRIVLGIVCAAALAVTSASAQQKRVRGTIEQVDGPVLTIKSRDGDTLKVKMADDAKVVALVKATLADIKPGLFVGSTAMPQEDGRWKAVEVHIFPEAMRGTGEGDRPYDYKPKSTMTNGTVSALAKSTVEKAEGTTLTLNYKEGEKENRCDARYGDRDLCTRQHGRTQIRGQDLYSSCDPASGWDADDGACQCRPRRDAADVIRR